jgi:hypothetical protein
MKPFFGEVVNKLRILYLAFKDDDGLLLNMLIRLSLH